MICSVKTPLMQGFLRSWAGGVPPPAPPPGASLWQKQSEAIHTRHCKEMPALAAVYPLRMLPLLALRKTELACFSGPAAVSAGILSVPPGTIFRFFIGQGNSSRGRSKEAERLLPSASIIGKYL